MPRAQKTDNWKDIPPPQTGLQKGHFINACVTWLVHEPDGDTEPDDFEQTSVLRQSNEPTQTSSSFAYTQTELNAISVGVCSFCEERPSTTFVTANPFSQRCYVLLCSQCVTRH